MDKTYALKIDDVRKSFEKVEAVKGISLNVRPGEVVGVVGPNGAGKTTTIKMILGLLEPDKGSIKIFGHDIQENDVRTRIGYMPENPSFYAHLTGRELIVFAGELFGIEKKKLAARASELLKLVGLEKAGDRQLHGYSKGMLQRICLAQALVNEPELLFLDEPLDGLDPIGRIEMKEILLNVKKRGAAIVLNSHILSDVAAVSDTIVIMYQGKMVKTGSVEKLVPKGRTLEEVFFETIAKEQK